MKLWTADLTVTADFIESNLVYCAVAVSEIRGFYALSRDDTRFELEHMWVDPRHMRGGLGERLFRHAVDTVRSLGGTLLEIASDPNAEGFYLRMGCRRIGAIASTPPGRQLPVLVVELDRE
jgi:GNAT superfamily N-acetyltransferase